METLRRLLAVERTTVDDQKGIVDYVASDESLDSYGEIARADGWRFNNFAKNSPFVDSHDYSTIAKCVGKVTDFRVSGGKLIERVQWAIGCGNELADLGWSMTKAGFLKAVSVGFFPTKYLTPSSGQAWTDALAELKLPADAQVRTIYTEQEQVELSACIIGANPNALASARTVGLLSDSHLEKYPEIRKVLELRQRSKTTFSFARQTQADSREDFMSKLNIIMNKSGIPTPTRAFDHLEMTRRAGTAGEITHSFAQARLAVASERRNGGLDLIEQHLRQPGRREFWMALARFMQRGGAGADCLTLEQKSALREMQAINAGLQTKDLDATAGGTGASFFLGQAMSQDIFDLMLNYGAFRTLGLRMMEKQFTKYAKITGRPAAVFIPPSTQSATPIPADVTATGSSLLPEANYVAALLNISLQLLEDNKVDFARLMVETFTQSLAARIDFACFMATGAVDANNGGQTGMFLDNTIAASSANVGNSRVESMGRSDFLNAVAAVAPAALQRPCSWWINPAWLPILAKLQEANGAYWLLKTPAETRDGTFSLVGFPVVWSAVCPQLDAAGTQFAAFGHGDSYLVAMREEFELQSSVHSKWNSLQSQYRAAARVFCETREATGLTILSTAAK